MRRVVFVVEPVEAVDGVFRRARGCAVVSPPEPREGLDGVLRRARGCAVVSPFEPREGLDVLGGGLAFVRLPGHSPAWSGRWSSSRKTFQAASMARSKARRRRGSWLGSPLVGAVWARCRAAACSATARGAGSGSGAGAGASSIMVVGAEEVNIKDFLKPIYHELQEMFGWDER